MIKKATGIWRYILVALIIVLSVSLIIGITSCENVDTDDYQETITDEPESQSQSQSQSEIDSGLNSESEQESESESEKETIQAKSVEGIITEVNKEKKDTHVVYSFKIEGNDNLYELVINNDSYLFTSLFKVGKKISIEYIESAKEGICIVQKFSF